MLTGGVFCIRVLVFSSINSTKGCCWGEVRAREKTSRRCVRAFRRRHCVSVAARVAKGDSLRGLRITDCFTCVDRQRDRNRGSLRGRVRILQEENVQKSGILASSWARAALGARTDKSDQTRSAGWKSGRLRWITRAPLRVKGKHYPRRCILVHSQWADTRERRLRKKSRISRIRDSRGIRVPSALTPYRSATGHRTRASTHTYTRTRIRTPRYVCLYMLRRDPAKEKGPSVSIPPRN